MRNFAFFGFQIIYPENKKWIFSLLWGMDISFIIILCTSIDHNGKLFMKHAWRKYINKSGLPYTHLLFLLPYFLYASI